MVEFTDTGSKDRVPKGKHYSAECDCAIASVPGLRASLTVHSLVPTFIGVPAAHYATMACCGEGLTTAR